MRSRLSGKPGWFFSMTLCVGVLALMLVVHYLVDRPLGWEDVSYAVGYSVLFTLFRRATDRPRNRASQPPTEHQDTPSPLLSFRNPPTR